MGEALDKGMDFEPEDVEGDDDNNEEGGGMGFPFLVSAKRTGE